MKGLKRFFARCRSLSLQDIWDVELTSLSRLRRWAIHWLRVIYLVFRGFVDDECPLHAAALTFTSIMAIVPVLALSLALARGFGNSDIAKEKIRDSISDWTSNFRASQVTNVVSTHDVIVGVDTGVVAAVSGSVTNQPAVSGDLAADIEYLVEEAFAKVENISFTALGAIGLTMLLYMVVMVLGRVESSFNRVWGVRAGRPLWRKVTDYLSVVLILPFLMVLASSMPVADFVTRFLDDSHAGVVRALLNTGLLKGVTVLLTTSLTFTFVLMFMPNTKVQFRAGFVGGLVVAILFILWLKACAALQVGVAKYGKIYGSFAVFPIVLLWIQVSWEIVLFGAEFAFAVQNAATYRMEQGVERASVQARVLLGLSVVTDAARTMVSDQGHFDVRRYAGKHRVPVRLLNSVIAQLTEMGLLGELSDAPGSFALLRAPEALKARDVVVGMLEFGVKPNQLGLRQMDDVVHDVVAKMSIGIKGELAEVTVMDMVGNER